MAQLRIPAVYMRGGTSKGVFLRPEDLPEDPAERDKLLLRIIGSPDPYGKQIDGMGAATSSTSKVVLVSKSEREDCDVDYLFGQVKIDEPMIDWSGNCGNLTTAVGPFAISEGLVDTPPDGMATVRIWQANIGKRIVAHVPVKGGQVVEEGTFELDGVTFPAAEVKLEFMDPGADGEMFPTGAVAEKLGDIEATLINAGNPTIFVSAASVGLKGTEMQADIDNDSALLARLEALRCEGSVKMGLAKTLEEAGKRGHTPKLSFIAPPAAYTASDGRKVHKDSIDLLARILSMGKLHHAMTGTGGVAIAAAAAIPGTLVQKTLRPGAGLTDVGRIRFGHPSGTLGVGAEAVKKGAQWTVSKVLMSRSARRLMEGWVRIPKP